MKGQAWAAIRKLYERHTQREESERLPMAARPLSGEEFDHVGRALRERRGIGPVEDWHGRCR